MTPARWQNARGIREELPTETPRPVSLPQRTGEIRTLVSLLHWYEVKNERRVSTIEPHPGHIHLLPGAANLLNHCLKRDLTTPTRFTGAQQVWQDAENHSLERENLAAR